MSSSQEPGGDGDRSSISLLRMRALRLREVVKLIQGCTARQKAQVDQVAGLQSPSMKQPGGGVFAENPAQSWTLKPGAGEEEVLSTSFTQSCKPRIPHPTPVHCPTPGPQDWAPSPGLSFGTWHWRWGRVGGGNWPPGSCCHSSLAPGRAGWPGRAPLWHADRTVQPPRTSAANSPRSLNPSPRAGLLAGRSPAVLF